MASTAPGTGSRQRAGVPGTVVSRDGTTIAYERIGAGPPLVVVDGAFNSLEMGTGRQIAPALAGQFTVYIYDRRGRGGSGDTPPYETAREIEDLHAMLAAAASAAGTGATTDTGNDAAAKVNVFGHSSGATLALGAVRQGLPVRRLALYEPPMVVDNSRPPVGDRFGGRIQDLVDEGHRGTAAKLFMTEGVRVPKAVTVVMPLMPAWKKVKAVAHTAPYDIAFTEEYLHGQPLPKGRWDGVNIPVLILEGGKSPDWMRNAMRELSHAIPGATLHTLEGQTHMLKPKATAPVLAEFFA
ncbi:MAG TPA: alpha/beta hydrolase [Trebonia sp.]|nr:alpha/beta hydrolase [Trebonia sp.]